MYFIFVTSSSLQTAISRHFSSLPKHLKIPQLQKVPIYHRPKAVLQAQQALTDYLHTTRSLPFTHAEHISKNSHISLANIISRVQFSRKTFSKDFLKFLSYHPINEFEFFFESIGIPFPEIERFLPPTELFLSENDSILDVVHVLVAFGFPWNKLGMLYKEDISIFGKDSKALKEKLYSFVALGFDTCSVVGICLAFPFVLSDNDGIDSLLEILKRVFLDYNLKSSVQENVDASYGFCRKIKVFIDLGCGKNEVGELMGKSWNVFLQCSEEVIVHKVDFFRRLNAEEKDVGFLLLRCPEILQYDFENPRFTVMDFLKQFGLSDEELNDIAVEYPHVMGKNKLINSPNVMRALDLHKWFFNKILDGNHHLLVSPNIDSLDEKLEKDYKNCLERIQGKIYIRQSKRYHQEAMDKLNFLLGIGFGVNVITMSVLSELHGTGIQLQERFDYLLYAGVEFSKLTMMIKREPMVLNQRPELLKEKLNFLCYDIGDSLEYLDKFPRYLTFDLENRIKPRYGIHMWLKEKGVVVYSLATILNPSENRFVARLLNMHPTALKQWLECFSP